jgi:uncharacterized protein (DUF1015 family)
MPAVHPFRAVRYQASGDVSAFIAPPYDVLDAGAKQSLLAREARNVVAVDLPHVPAKELGPPQAYQAAGALYRSWRAGGTLKPTERPVMFACRQTFPSHRAGGKPHQRCGVACTLELVPFGRREGGGVLPHEETFGGPKQDRLALMHATGAQLSPIFGLHTDERGQARALLDRICSRRPDVTARTADGTFHETWTLDRPEDHASFQQALAGEDVFIADGHHRYNTALNYLAELESRAAIPPDHPARRVMFVLVGMSDPGLVIWPTHRVLGGMKTYTFDALRTALAGTMLLSEVRGGLSTLATEMTSVTLPPPPMCGSVLGFFDFASGRAAVGTFVKADPLQPRFPDKPAAWRNLDVALVQHVVVEQACQPRLNAGQPVKWAFPHTIAEVEAIGRGEQTGAGGFTAADPAQLAVIVRPTPLPAVRDISRAGVLMPQKSTYFFPKLATGMFIHELA